MFRKNKKMGVPPPCGGVGLSAVPRSERSIRRNLTVASRVCFANSHERLSPLLLSLTQAPLGLKPKSYCASSVVQPDGMPCSPVVQPVVLAGLTKVPLVATLLTQIVVQLSAEILVARHLI